MSETELINRNLSNYIPFKTADDVIKTEWKGAFWNRKQVRVRIESSGKISVQSVAQNRLAQLASAIIKFLSRGHIKSFGKRVVTYTNANYTLPANLSVPLSEQTQKQLFNIQCEKLAQILLPTHQKLFNLGAELMEYALGRSLSQKVCLKALDMNGEVLNLQYSVTQHFLQDLAPEEIHAKIVAYEAQAQAMLETFPKELEKFIDEFLKDQANIPAEEIKNISEITKPKVEKPKQPVHVAEELVEITPELVVDEIKDPDPVIEIPVESPSKTELPTENQVLPSPAKVKFLHLLEFANNHVTDLRNRNQFFSAEWLEGQIEKVTEQFALQVEDKKSIKKATESLENALDCTDQNMSFLDQLLALQEGSPSEEILKELVVKDIRTALARFSENLDARMKDVSKLLNDSGESAWHQSLKDFYETTNARTKELENCHDIFNSRIPGVETALHWVNSLTDNTNPLIPLESLGKSQLAAHKALVDEHCAKALYFLENETKVERILNFTAQYKQLAVLVPEKLEQLKKNGQYLQLAELENARDKHAEIIRKRSPSLSSALACKYYAYDLAAAIEALQEQFHNIEKSAAMDSFEQLEGLKQLASPYYETLHLQIVAETKKSLDSYIVALSSYQNTLSVYIPILEERQNELVEPLKAMDTKINLKISEAKALSVDYTTRLHAWQIFSSPVPLKELPPLKLKEYAEKISVLVKDGMEEITEGAADIGFKFD